MEELKYELYNHAKGSKTSLHTIITKCPYCDDNRVIGGLPCREFCIYNHNTYVRSQTVKCGAKDNIVRS